MPNAKALLPALLPTLLLVSFSACNSGAPAPQSRPETPPPIAPFTADDLTRLSAASCPDHAAFITPQPIALTVTEIAPETREGATLNGLAFAGGWHLTSPEPNFGGLSGLTVHPKDHLLAVSDAGAFIWISMQDDAPSGFAAISYMRDEAGQHLQGKEASDSEGLELADGLALVSFERNHRVMAFDVANCGAAANGILVANIPDALAGLGRKIPENEGAEGLTLSADNQLIAGLEIKAGQGAPIVHIAPDKATFSNYITRPTDKRLVGLDTHDGVTFSLFRSYSPLTGNANEIHARLPGNPEPTVLAHLKRPFPVDNFEGLTATRLPDGTVRLYIISDDNFSGKQRTLLMAFDVVDAQTIPAN